MLLACGYDIAFAHHPMDGAMPQTWWHGLASGLAHPVIGLDHLAFICAIGLAGVMIGARLLLPLAFVAGTVAGCLLHVGAIDLPAVEIIVAASLVAIGAGLVVQLRGRTAVWLLGSAASGLWHGYAYGETVVGAEASPVVFYLIGFGAVQLAIALIAAFAADHCAAMRTQRAAGAAAIGVGSFMLLTAILPAALAPAGL